MQDSTVTLIVGVAGILGTLISSAIGHYYTAKARKDVYQRAVFTEQFELLKKIHLQIGRAQNFLQMIVPPHPDHHEQAEADCLALIPELANLIHEGSALLPSEVWVDLSQFSSKLCEIFECSDRSSDEAKEIARDVRVRAGIFALATRKMLGIDEMSTETYKMLTGSNAEDLMSDGERAALARIAGDDAQTVNDNVDRN